MGSAISGILSPAVGVLVSPFPIVGLILILLSERARKNSITYTVGWMFGITLMFTIAMLGVREGVAADTDSGLVKRLVFIALGALMLGTAWKEFDGRPRQGEQPKTPKWFAKMSKISPIGAMGFGAFLSALNPKNALLLLSAGASAGALNLSAGQEVITAVVFVVLASASILVPTVLFMIMGDRLNKTFDALRTWLIQNNAIVTAVMLMMIGLNMIGKAFG